VSRFLPSKCGLVDHDRSGQATSLRRPSVPDLVLTKMPACYAGENESVSVDTPTADCPDFSEGVTMSIQGANAD